MSDVEAGSAISPEDSREEEPEADAGTPVVRPNELRVVNLIGVSVDLPASHPTVVLREAESPWREIRIEIGYPEGIAMARAWRRLPAPRPLTHEVWADVLTGFNISMEVVRLTGVTGSVFAAEAVFVNGATTLVVPCRPTDAITLSLRQQFSVPILAAESVLEAAQV